MAGLINRKEWLIQQVVFKRNRALLILLSVLFLSSCATTLVYQNIDWFAYRYVNNYVDLDRDQRRQFKRQVKDLAGWYRDEELPQYLSLLKAIEQDLQSSLSVTQVQQRLAVLASAYQRGQEKSVQYLSRLQSNYLNNKLHNYSRVCWQSSASWKRNICHVASKITWMIVATITAEP